MLTVSTASIVSMPHMDVVAQLATAKDFPDEEWDAYLDLLVKLAQKHGGDPSRIRTLVITDGAAPNAKQRGRMQRIFDPKAHKIAVLTLALSNPLKQGIATAISWINPEFRAMTPDRWREALVHLDIRGEAPTMSKEFERLQARLPPIATFHRFKAAVEEDHRGLLGS